MFKLKTLTKDDVAEGSRKLLLSARKLLGFLFPHLTQLNYRAAYLVLASLVIGLAFVLSIGPTIQEYLVALSVADQPSIYAAVYKDQLVEFPGLLGWFTGWWHAWPLGMSLLIVLFGVRSRSIRHLAITLTVAGTVALTAYDLAVLIITSDISANSVVTNFVANALGSAFAAGLAVAVLKSCDFLILRMAGGRGLRLAVSIALPVIAGISVSALTFVAARMFFGTMPLKIDAYLNAPNWGYFAKEPATKSSPKKDADLPFDYFPTGKVNSELKFIVNDGLAVKWRKSATPSNASVALLSECLVGDVRKMNYLSAADIKLPKVQSLQLFFDKGASEWDTFNGARNGQSIKVISDNARIFWLNKGKRKDTIELSQFITHAALDYSTSPAASMYMDVILLKGKSDKKLGVTAPPTLTIVANNRTHRFHFNPSKSVKLSSKLSCKPLRINDFDPNKDSDTQVDNAGLMVGAAVAVTPVDETADEAMPSMNFQIKSSDGGWLSMVDLSYEEAYSSNVYGWVPFIQFTGNVATMEAGNRELKTQHAEIFTVASGKIFGNFDDSGHLRLHGSAKYIFKDGERFNKTQWESFDWPYRTAIISALAAPLLWIGRLLVLWLKLNGRIRLLDRRNLGTQDDQRRLSHDPNTTA